MQLTPHTTWSCSSQWLKRGTLHPEVMHNTTNDTDSSRPEQRSNVVVNKPHCTSNLILASDSNKLLTTTKLSTPAPLNSL